MEESFGIFREGFLAGLHCFRQVAGLAIGVHDQQARAAVFFVTQTAEFLEGVDRGLEIWVSR